MVLHTYKFLHCLKMSCSSWFWIFFYFTFDNFPCVYSVFWSCPPHPTSVILFLLYILKPLLGFTLVVYIEQCVTRFPSSLVTVSCSTRIYLKSSPPAFVLFPQPVFSVQLFSPCSFCLHWVPTLTMYRLSLSVLSCHRLVPVSDDRSVVSHTVVLS